MRDDFSIEVKVSAQMMFAGGQIDELLGTRLGRVDHDLGLDAWHSDWRCARRCPVNLQFQHVTQQEIAQACIQAQRLGIR